MGADHKQYYGHSCRDHRQGGTKQDGDRQVVCDHPQVSRMTDEAIRTAAADFVTLVELEPDHIGKEPIHPHGPNLQSAAQEKHYNRSPLDFRGHRLGPAPAVIQPGWQKNAQHAEDDEFSDLDIPRLNIGFFTARSATTSREMNWRPMRSTAARSPKNSHAEGNCKVPAEPNSTNPTNSQAAGICAIRRMALRLISGSLSNNAFKLVIGIPLSWDWTHIPPKSKHPQ